MNARRVGCGLAIATLGATGSGCGQRGGHAVSFPTLASAVQPLQAAPATPTPAPQLTAPTAAPPQAVRLDSGWRYLPDRDNVGISQGWARGGAANLNWAPVTIPDDFNPTISRAGTRPGAAWYELRFQGPPTAVGRAWRVSFESVRRHAIVWLNGRRIGTSSDPYPPFSLPASTLRPAAPNVLVVRVDDFKAPGSLPEDWWNWGGILGPVSLQPVGRLELTDTAVIPELGCAYRCGALLVKGTIVNHAGTPLPAQLRISVAGPAGGATAVTVRTLPALAPGASAPVSLHVPVAAPLSLWSPAHPLLYGVTVQTLAAGRVEQQQPLRIGMRVAQVRGGILYLNGTRVWLHGAAIHEDVAGRGAALSDGDIDTLVSQLRSLGANITRAHYLLNERLLSALDAAGIMVWEEPPVEHADQQLASSAGRTQALALLRSTITAARNHPAVIVDSVGNELTPTPDTTPGTAAYLSQAIPVARHLNPVVPVALDIYCYPGFPAQRSYSSLDILGISDYFGWYSGPPGHSITAFAALRPYLLSAHARYPQQALVISEYGAEALFDGSPVIKGSFEFQSGYIRRTLSLLDQLPFMSGSIYWTLREFAVGPGWRGGASLPPGSAPDGIHHKGLIAYDGTAKPAFTVAAQLLSREPGFVGG